MRIRRDRAYRFCDAFAATPHFLKSLTFVGYRSDREIGYAEEAAERRRLDMSGIGPKRSFWTQLNMSGKGG